MPIPDDHNWSAGMLLRWVLTRDEASVLTMAKKYGAWWVDVENKGVERIQPQGWDNVVVEIDYSLPAEKRLTEAIVRSDIFAVPAIKEIHDLLRRGYLQCQARRNGSGDVENVGREQWGGLRICSFEGRDVAVPVTSEAERLQRRSLPEYLSGSVPANDTPTVWVDLVFSAEQAMRLWPPDESSVVVGPWSDGPGMRPEEAPAPPPETCIEQTHRAAYERRLAEFRKDHPDQNPPLQKTKDGLNGDREWAAHNGISRDEIRRFRKELLKTKRGRPPQNSAENSSKK
jgi:hypothetical protein